MNADFKISQKMAHFWRYGTYISVTTDGTLDTDIELEDDVDTMLLELMDGLSLTGDDVGIAPVRR